MVILMAENLVVPQPHLNKDGVSESDTLPMTLDSVCQNLMYVLLGEINNLIIEKKINIEDVGKKLGWSLSKTYRVKDSDIKLASNLGRVVELAKACGIQADITVSIKK